MTGSTGTKRIKGPVLLGPRGKQPVTLGQRGQYDWWEWALIYFYPKNLFAFCIFMNLYFFVNSCKLTILLIVVIIGMSIVESSNRTLRGTCPSSESKW